MLRFHEKTPTQSKFKISMSPRILFKSPSNLNTVPQRQNYQMLRNERIYVIPKNQSPIRIRGCFSPKVEFKYENIVRNPQTEMTQDAKDVQGNHLEKPSDKQDVPRKNLHISRLTIQPETIITGQEEEIKADETQKELKVSAVPTQNQSPIRRLSNQRIVITVFCPVCQRKFNGDNAKIHLVAHKPDTFIYPALKTSRLQKVNTQSDKFALTDRSQQDTTPKRPILPNLKFSKASNKYTESLTDRPTDQTQLQQTPQKSSKLDQTRRRTQASQYSRLTENQ